MPKVTIRPSAATAAARWQASRNSSGLRTTWSAASTSTRASRSRSAEKGGDGHRKTGIAAHRLEHDVGLDAALAQLLGDDKAEVGAGNDDRSCEQVGMGNARKHLLESRSRSDERNELLGHALA